MDASSHHKNPEIISRFAQRLYNTKVQIIQQFLVFWNVTLASDP
jgi:hypothetical protein